MAILVANNATSYLAGSLTTVATSLTVAIGTGSLFPTLSGSDVFYVTLTNVSNQNEIVKVTAKASDTFTIVRAQDGTTAKSFAIGDKVELRLIKAVFDDKASLTDNNTFSGTNNIVVNTSSDAVRITQTGTGNALVVEDSTNPDSTPFVVDASGNVGIGTTAPSYKLDVKDGAIRVNNSAGTDADLRFANNASTAGKITYTSQNMTFTAAGNERMRIDSSGRLLIGTSTAPLGSSALIVADGNLNNGGIQLNYSTTGGGLIASNTGAGLLVYTYTGAIGSETYTERMRIDSSGNVGIGTSSPANKLDVEGGGRFVQYAAPSTGAIRLRQSTGDTYGAYIQWVNNANSVEKGYIAVDPSTQMLFALGGSEKMRIDSSGNVGIGTISPTGKMQLYNSVSDTGLNVTSGSVNILVNSQDSSALGQIGTTSAHPVSVIVSGTERMRIRTEGNVIIGSSTGSAAVSFYVLKNITGGTTAYGILANGQVQSDVTTAYNFMSSNNVASGTSLTTYTHFRATEGTISGTITTQTGFDALSDLTSATTNYGFRAQSTAAITAGKTSYGFYSAINTATGGGTTYGFYAAGTASNIMPNLNGGIAASSTLTLQSTAGAGTTDAVIISTASQSERMRVDTSGLVATYQPAQTSKAAAATLTAAELQTRIIQYTGAAATLTLPTGTNLEGVIASGQAVNTAFDITFINTGAGTLTIGANGNTTVGTLTLATLTSATFRFRKTAANTFTIYRL